MRFKDYIREYEDRTGGKKSSMDKANGVWQSGKMNTRKIFGHLWGGMLYSFKYVSARRVEKLKKREVDYYDYTPYILCLNALPEDKMVVGLNLNILPLAHRMLLFGRITEAFAKWDEVNKTYTLSQRIGINHGNLGRVLNMKSNVAINKYDRKNMQDVHEISWDNYPNVIYLSTGKIKLARGVSMDKLTKKI